MWRVPGVLLLLGAVTAAAQTPAPVSAPATTPPPQVAALQAQLDKLHAQLSDWPDLARYRADNAALPPPAPGEKRVVFLGDSITDIWGRLPDRGVFFPGKPYVNRGISGQTTEQILLRFEGDVVALRPAAVVILAGTNDVAGNTGPMTPEMTENNWSAMAAIARQNGIRVLFASITPAAAFPWRPGVPAIEGIRTRNAWLRAYCTQNGYEYIDYYDALAAPDGSMRPGLSSDGVHPTTQGFAIMAPLAEAAIAKALAKRAP